MARKSFTTSSLPRPTLTSIDVELLTNILHLESKYFRQICTSIDASSKPFESTTSENDSPHCNVAAILLRRVGNIQEIHNFFKQLTPNRYKMKLAGQMEPGQFQVVVDNYRPPYSGSQLPKVSFKESDKQLHLQELHFYKCVLLAAHYPVLAVSDHSMHVSCLWKQKQKENDLIDSRLTPASKECMSFQCNPMKRSSVFPLEAEHLIEMVRLAFCLTHRRHEYYLRDLEKIIDNDPAKVLIKEMRELYLILDSNCHPCYSSEKFFNRQDFHRWLSTEKEAIQSIVRNQEKRTPYSVHSYPKEIPLLNKDKHSWFTELLLKLFRAESLNSRMNVGTKEAIPKEPLSEASLRLLDEFGERYRIGVLYRHVVLLQYLARNFDGKKWYCQYVISILKAILDLSHQQDFIVRKDEATMLRTAITHLHSHVKHLLTRINRVFPKNMPEGELQEVIRLLLWLVVVDDDNTFGNSHGMSVEYYLKSYVKEEMHTNYERQKIIVADQLKLRSFGQRITPRMISLMLYDISEKLRNYRLYFKDEFIRYFDIFEIGVEVYHSLLMEDVLELCDGHPVNEESGKIDYQMIALAYRLNTFDQDSEWRDYLPIEGQVWRPAFLKYSFALINVLHRKIQSLIVSALNHDTWRGLSTLDEHVPESDMSLQSRVRTRPQAVPSPPSDSTSVLRGTVTPSCNSAFQPVYSQGKGAIDIEFQHDDNATCSNSNEQSSTTAEGSPSKQPASSKITKMPVNFSDSSKSLESIYVDAESDFSNIEDYLSCEDEESVHSIISEENSTMIPVSTSFVDIVCVVNRCIHVVRHFAQVLCPDAPKIDYGPLRMSPEDCDEIRAKLEQGRRDMANKLVHVIQSLVSLYCHYVIGYESSDLNETLLESIIGEQCLTRSLNVIPEERVRLRKNSAEFSKRSTSKNSQKTCLPSSNCRPLHNEKVVEEMCVRLNNVHTLKKHLSFFVETAEKNVLNISGKYSEDFGQIDVSNPTSNEASTSQAYAQAQNSMASNGNEKSLEKTLEELQEIEDGLVKLMAYRANDCISKLLRFLLTLNLGSFNAKKRFRPVLCATRRTLHTLAANLYPDCYTAVLREFWLAIGKDFVEEKENLFFLTVSAKEKADLLLEAVSHFIDIFRAEEDFVPFAFISTNINSVFQSLSYYTLPSRTLIQMYEALERTGLSTFTSGRNSRHRYQRNPSNVFINDVRIELHSENAYFSGYRFVECVSDQIRYRGNLGLGFCAVPNGCDADSSKVFGQYLLDNEILTYVGDVVQEANCYNDSEDDDEDLLCVNGTFFCPVNKKRQKTFNDVLIAGSPDSKSSVGEDYFECENTVIIHKDARTRSRFINSREVLYKFKFTELEDSTSNYYPDYNIDAGVNCSNQKEIITVLFTRRNVEQEARDFFINLGENCAVKELEKKLKEKSSRC